MYDWSSFPLKTQIEETFNIFVKHDYVIKDAVA